MALFEKKQELSRGEMKEKPRPVPSPKEEKKDTSVFGGKPSLQRWEVREELRKDEVYRILRKPKEERAKLEKKLFDLKRFRELIEPKEVRKVYNELKDFPIKFRKKYGISEGERLNILKLLKKKFLGK